MSSAHHVVVALAEAEHGEPAVHPYLIGVIALVLLLGLLFAVMSFGAGREHS